MLCHLLAIYSYYLQIIVIIYSSNPKTHYFYLSTPYIAPLFPNTTPTVLITIFISNPRLQFVIYSLSNLTTSSKSVISLLPLTCHIPVIPGFMASLTRWCSSYLSHSSMVGGLVPTRLISPFSTFQN